MVPAVKRPASAVLAAALAIGVLAGCEAGPSSSGASGVVGKRETHETRYGDKYYEITVREDGGKRDKGRVTRKTYESCQVGDRWPDCKK